MFGYIKKEDVVDILKMRMEFNKKMMLEFYEMERKYMDVPSRESAHDNGDKFRAAYVESSKILDMINDVK